MKLAKIILSINLILFSGIIFAQSDTSDIGNLSLEELMQIEVYSANKKIETVAEIPSSIVIISRQQIKENGWQTLEEILSHVPGMYIINDYLWFGTDNYGVRGFFSTGSFKSMIIMVNGVSQKEDWYNSFPLTKVNVPVEAIDRIEVIRGPMSVVYGNSAFLGAINIITNNGNTGNIACPGGGTNGNYKVFARIAGQNGDLNYAFNGSFYGSDGIKERYDQMMSDPYNASTGIPSWSLPNDITSENQLTDNRKYIDLSLKYKGFYFNMSQTGTKRGVIDYYPGFDDGHLAEIQSSNSVVGYSNNLSENADLNFKIGYYNFRNRLGYKHNSDTTAYGFNDIFSDAYDAELNFNLKSGNHFETSFGAYYQQVLRDKLVVDAPNLSDNYVNLDAGLSRKNTKLTWAVFLQSTYKIAEKIHLIGGIRLEQTPKYTINYAVRFDPKQTYTYLSTQGTYQYNDIHLIPRAAVLYSISENHHLKLMYGMAIKEASIGENMDIVRYPDRPQLKPSTMQTIELNYIGVISSFASINFSLFQNNADQLISRTNTLQNGVMKLFNTNSGKLRTNGTELSFLLKPTDNLTSRLSVTYQISENLQSGYEDIDLEYAPKLLAYLDLTYRFMENSSIAFSGYYIDEMETYWKPSSSSLDPKDGSRIGKKVPAYFLGNVNVSFTNLFKTKLFCNLYAYNVLNTKIWYPATRSNDQFDKGTIGYGRYFLLGIGVNF